MSLLQVRLSRSGVLRYPEGCICLMHAGLTAGPPIVDYVENMPVWFRLALGPLGWYNSATIRTHNGPLTSQQAVSLFNFALMTTSNLSIIDSSIPLISFSQQNLNLQSLYRFVEIISNSVFVRWTTLPKFHKSIPFFSCFNQASKFSIISFALRVLKMM